MRAVFWCRPGLPRGSGKIIQARGLDVAAGGIDKVARV